MTHLADSSLMVLKASFYYRLCYYIHVSLPSSTLMINVPSSPGHCVLNPNVNTPKAILLPDSRSDHRHLALGAWSFANGYSLLLRMFICYGMCISDQPGLILWNAPSSSYIPSPSVSPASPPLVAMDRIGALMFSHVPGKSPGRQPLPDYLVRLSS